MTAMEVLKAKSVPESLYEGKTQKEINALARAIDPTWKAPVEANVEVVHYEPKGKGKPGMFLKIQTSGYGGIFERLCDGEKLTADGRTKALSLLVSIANQAGDLVDSL